MGYEDEISTSTGANPGAEKWESGWGAELLKKPGICYSGENGELIDASQLDEDAIKALGKGVESGAVSLVDKPNGYLGRGYTRGQQYADKVSEEVKAAIFGGQTEKK